MGKYVNPDIGGTFADLKNADAFVDKTGLIQFTNEVLGDPSRNKVCVSCPQRFGKTSAITMLSAYYSRGCDSRELFHGLSIENSPTYEEHLNHHNVIHLDIQKFRLEAEEKNRLHDLPRYIQEQVIADLVALYPEEAFSSSSSLSDVLRDLHRAHGEKFIFFIDEWDAVYREDPKNAGLKQDFTDFLKKLFKGGDADDYLELAYMTGILPIQKENSESALNSFFEATMLKPRCLAEYMGFTEEEVKILCEKNRMSFENIRHWYGGYHLCREHSTYCPASVVTALEKRKTVSYWSEYPFDCFLKDVLTAEMPGLRNTMGKLLSYQSVKVDCGRFEIDFSNPRCADDALISLVHRGYLTWDERTGTVRIPNPEVFEVFYSALKAISEHPAWKIICESRQLLKDTLDGNAEEVARAIQSAHDYSGTIMYNDESTLATAVLLAYHLAVEEDYSIIREFPSGKGFVDILLLPLKENAMPILIELKHDNHAETAISQIKEHRYSGRLKGFSQVLLVDISYGSDWKKPGYKEHTCIIEPWSLS